MNNIIDTIIEKGNSNTKPNDYVKDGILYCGVCNQPKQCVKEFPTGSGKMRKFPIVCQCDIDEENAFQERMRRQEWDDYVRRLYNQGLTDRAYLKNTFENDDNRNPELTDFCKKYVASWNSQREHNNGVLFYGGTGGGCIAGILVFCFLSGNIFLFGGINEAKDNSFAIMMVIFALFADIFLAVYLIGVVLNSISKKNSNNNTHQDKSDTLYKNTFDNPEEINGKKYTAFYEPEKQPSIETKSDTITPLPNHKEIFAEGFIKSEVTPNTDTNKSSSKSDNEV